MVEVVSVVVAVLKVSTRLSVEDTWTRLTSRLVNIRVMVRSDRSVVEVVVVSSSVDGVKVKTLDDTLVIVKLSVTVCLMDLKALEVDIEVTVERPTVVNVFEVALTLCLINSVTGVVISWPMNRVILDVWKETEMIETSCMSIAVVITLYIN